MRQTSKPIVRITFLLAVVALLNACGGQDRNDATANNVPVFSGPPSAPANSVATFTGVRANYTITKTSTGFTVKDNVGKDGTVNLTVQTTAMKFSDITINLLVGDKSKTIPAATLKSLIELYIAFFNRVPDADGMAYWIDQLKAGTTIQQLSNNFYAAAIQFSNLTGYSDTMSNADFVTKIYKNVLGRDTVDQEGMNYWTKALADGTQTRGSLINTIINSAHGFKGDAGFGWVADLLDNKIDVGTFVSIQQGINFNTPELSISEGMKIAAAVTPTDTKSAKGKTGSSDDAFDLTAAAKNDDFAKVQAIVNAHCLECHSTTRAENGIMLHTEALIRQNADALYLQTVVTRKMPQNGTLSANEIADITKWYKDGKK